MPVELSPSRIYQRLRGRDCQSSKGWMTTRHQTLAPVRVATIVCLCRLQCPNVSSDEAEAVSERYVVRAHHQLLQGNHGEIQLQEITTLALWYFANKQHGRKDMVR